MNRLLHNRPLLVMSLAVLSGCNGDPEPSLEDNDRVRHVPLVITTSYPLYVMTSLVAADDFIVKFPAADGGTPQVWKPTGAQIQELQNADLILMNGSGYEPWAHLVTLPRSRTVDTSLSYFGKLLKTDAELIHQHGPRGDKSDSEFEWATWLDPMLAKQQLQEVTTSLVGMRPELEDAIEKRSLVFGDELDKLEDKLRSFTTVGDQGRVTVTDGAFYGYLARRLSWDVHVLELTGSEQSEVASGFVETVKEKHADMLIYSARAPETFALLSEHTSIPTLRIDLCETEDVDATLLERLRANVDAIEAVYEQAGAPR